MAYNVNSNLSGTVGSSLSGGVNSTLSGEVGSKVSGEITVNSGTTEVKLIGDPAKPIGSDINMDVNIMGDKNKPVASTIDTKVTGDPSHPVATTLDTKITGDSNHPVASTMELLNIPRMTLNDIKDVLTPKIRMHIPNYQQMSFKVFGYELFSWCLSGEAEIITQPFVPNKFEECKIECPNEDNRPFPDKTPIHKKTNEARP
jgi:hypothetical protein